MLYEVITREILKGILIPLWNSYSFYVTYANIDSVERPTGAAATGGPSENPLDRWILSITEKMVLDVTTALDDYDLSRAIDPIIQFIDQLNNWYIRRSRRRFWKSENDGDKAQAYETLVITSYSIHYTKLYDCHLVVIIISNGRQSLDRLCQHHGLRIGENDLQ